ncbi:hypothetical protein DFR38_12040 [Aquitalea magnusonii]|uniref:Uncharacterized protein n=1 Tax=Aquitalea magnusonii TaxID=332411 RepID=A0A318J3L5_9NEIS|nr:hypothetical protein DFR38_12040 [Aquitalea magnusonii]
MKTLKYIFGAVLLTAAFFTAMGFAQALEQLP